MNEQEPTHAGALEEALETVDEALSRAGFRVWRENGELHARGPGQFIGVGFALLPKDGALYVLRAMKAPLFGLLLGGLMIALLIYDAVRLAGSPEATGLMPFGGPLLFGALAALNLFLFFMARRNYRAFRAALAQVKVPVREMARQA